MEVILIRMSFKTRMMNMEAKALLGRKRKNDIKSLRRIITTKEIQNLSIASIQVIKYPG